MSNVVTERVGGKQNLQEIPLAEGGVNGRHERENDTESQQERFLKELERSEGDNERKLKSTSLKRFFRMAPKKSSEPAEAALAGDHNVDLEGQNSIEDDEDAAVASSDTNREQHKRFKLRLGGIYRDSNSPDSESKIDLSDNASKTTLKSSLSNYWNSVFKKKKSKSVNDMQQTEVVTTTNFLETLNQDPPQQSCDAALVQGIHILKISEDSN